MSVNESAPATPGQVSTNSSLERQAPRPVTAKTRARSAFLSVTRAFNRVVLRLAGTRFLPLYGVLEHRGRRSGAIYRTPVVVRPAPDGFVVPMPWGETTNWYRNVRAAGGCVMRWNGRTYALQDPRVVQTQDAGASFGAFQRVMMRRLNIRSVLHLKRAA